MQERVWYGLTGEMKLETQQQVKIGAARRRSRVQGWRWGTSWGHLWGQRLRLQRTFSLARWRARSPAHLCLRPPESRPAGGVHGVSQWNILFFFKFPPIGSPTCLTIWPPPRFGICSMSSLSRWRMLTRRSSSMSFGNQNQFPHYNYYRVHTSPLVNAKYHLHCHSHYSYNHESRWCTISLSHLRSLSFNSVTVPSTLSKPFSVSSWTTLESKSF